MAEAVRNQTKDSQALFEQRYWDLVGKFAEHGFNIEMYSKVQDFYTRNRSCPNFGP
ncbi:MAG: hypothetical protein Ct9H90mP14_4020 [Methanobacteriota archaeon]|nr:MAG: hypothetical protein Ct9H90mP14_4020 [Euryarchaeota archaeon]